VVAASQPDRLVYKVFHNLIGARRWLQRFTDEVIRPCSGDARKPT
jgi:hypothetical protein